MTRPWDAEITESGSGPYLRLLGIEIVEADEGRALLRMPWSDPLDTFRINHVMHGGAIASLIDAAASMALRSRVASFLPASPPHSARATAFDNTRAKVSVSFPTAARTRSSIRKSGESEAASTKAPSAPSLSPTARRASASSISARSLSAGELAAGTAAGLGGAAQRGPGRRQV